MSKNPLTVRTLTYPSSFLGDGTWKRIPFDKAFNNADHNRTCPELSFIYTGVTTITIPTDGLYLLSANVLYNDSSDGYPMYIGARFFD